MNSPAEQTEQTTELVPLGVTETRLRELRAGYTGLTIADGDEASYKIVSQAIATLSGLRTAVENRRKELKAPVIERGKLIDAEAKRITAELQSIETPLVEERTRVIKAENERKLAAQKAEDDRKAKIAAALDNIDELARGLDGLSQEGLRAVIEKLKALEISEEVFQELRAEAYGRRDAWLMNAEDGLAKRIQRDEDDRRRAEETARLKAEREELEREKAKFREAQAAQEAKFWEAQAAQEAKDREEKARADERAKLERERQEREAEEARQKAEADRVAEEARRRAPDVEKVRVYLDDLIHAAGVPDITDPEILRIVNITAGKITKVVNDARHAVAELGARR